MIQVIGWFSFTPTALARHHYRNGHARQFSDPLHAIYGPAAPMTSRYSH